MAAQPRRARRVSLSEVLAALPWRDRLFVVYVGACATMPVALALSAMLGTRGAWGWLGERPWLSVPVALVAMALGAVVWERPATMRGYGRQLALRLAQMRAARDDAFRRHSEEAGHES